jgi:hypothetical protein
MDDSAERQSADELLRRRLDIIAVSAVDVLGFDAATVSARIGDSVATIATTDERFHDLDMAQYETMDGPCVEALDVRDAIYVADIADEDRWHAYREAAQRVGVRTSLSLNAMSTQRLASTLNLYACNPGGVGDQQIRRAQSFAAWLAAALEGSEMHRAAARLADQLADAMCVSAIQRALGLEHPRGAHRRP